MTPHTSTVLRAEQHQAGGPGRSSWLVPAALVALGTVPVVAGSLRLADLSGAATGMPVDPRYDASPLPVVTHIVCATVFAIVGAFQFAPRLRQRRPAWHRRAGRVLVVAGLGVALSALWLNQFFPRAEASREVLYPLRLAFGTAMVVTIVLGFRAARRRDFTRHRAWMIRSYAIGLVAGTQVLTLGLGARILGTHDVTTALLMAFAWVVNLAVAERAIRTGPRRRRAPERSAQPASP
ncbi:DUF2306 domain-containing protein [Ornithinimicrobium cavernae]|uniref:DUF2306 domain-containing protein n=1 Tax=Ornithinimicrobium cavernae TaxID=2666047 RepID=UPI000D6991F3|nr:DUF2306 domain-containing protein [Ornithinimicrobium cavernae]